MTIAVDLGRKANKQTNKQVHFNYVYVFAMQFIRVIQCTLVMCMCLLCNLSE